MSFSAVAMQRAVRELEQLSIDQRHCTILACNYCHRNFHPKCNIDLVQMTTDFLTKGNTMQYLTTCIHAETSCLHVIKTHLSLYHQLKRCNFLCHKERRATTRCSSFGLSSPSQYRADVTWK